MIFSYFSDIVLVPPSQCMILTRPPDRYVTISNKVRSNCSLRRWWILRIRSLMDLLVVNIFISNIEKVIAEHLDFPPNKVAFTLFPTHRK